VDDSDLERQNASGDSFPVVESVASRTGPTYGGDGEDDATDHFTSDTGAKEDAGGANPQAIIPPGTSCPSNGASRSCGRWRGRGRGRVTISAPRVEEETDRRSRGAGGRHGAQRTECATRSPGETHETPLTESIGRNEKRGGSKNGGKLIVGTRPSARARLLIWPT